MEEDKKPIIGYRDKAAVATIVFLVIGVLMLIVSVSISSGAQTAYYETVSEYSILADSAAEDLAAANTMAGAVSGFATLLIGVACISGFMWALANLAVAYMKSK